MMRMMMERMTSLLSLLTVTLHLSSVPFSPFFFFSSPLCLCSYHPHHPVPSHSSSLLHVIPIAPFSPSPLVSLPFSSLTVPPPLSSFFYSMHSSPCATFLLLLLLFLSVGSGGGVSRGGGCGSGGVHSGGSVGASHGGGVPRTFSIVKSHIMRCT